MTFIETQWIIPFLIYIAHKLKVITVIASYYLMSFTETTNCHIRILKLDRTINFIMIPFRMKNFTILIVCCLVIGIANADIFETNKAPTFNFQGCETKCLSLCLAG